MSLTLAELTDVTNTAQVSFETLVLSLKLLKNELLWILCMEQLGGVFLKKVRKNSVQPKVASAMMCYNPVVKICRVEKDLVGKIYKACENVAYIKPVVIHSIIHQQVPCRRHLNCHVSMVNFICFHGF